MLRARAYEGEDLLVRQLAGTLLEDILTTVERTLVDRGEENLVRKARMGLETFVLADWAGRK